MPEQRIDNLGAVGLNTDVMPSLLPPNVLTTANNVESSDGVLRSIQGERLVFVNGAKLDVEPIYHKTWVGFAGEQWAIVSDGVDVWAYAFDGDGVGEKITPTDDGQSTGTPQPWNNGFVSFAILNGLLVVNSASDGLFYWGGTGAPLLAAPGWDTTWKCKQIAAFRYQLIALGMTEDTNEYPHKIRWSTSAAEGDVPTIWDPQADNDAGDDILGETEGVIVGGTLVRDQLYIIKEDAVYAMRWIGGQYIHQVTRLEGGTGTRNPKGFCEMRGVLVVLTTSDVILFDGQNSKSLLDARARRAVYNAVSEGNWESAQVFYNPSTHILFMSYPTSNATLRLGFSLLYNREENTLSVYLLKNGYGFDLALIDYVVGVPQWDDISPLISGPSPRWIVDGTWDEQIDASWNKGVISPSNAQTIMYESDDAGTEYWMVFRQGNTNSDGTAKACKAGRTSMPIEGIPGLAQLNWVWPEISGKLVDPVDANVEVPVIMRFGGQETPEGQITWDPTQYQVYPDRTQTIDPRVTGRYISWEVSSEGVGEWSLGGLTFSWESAGRR